ncbi:MAG: heme NO-binding domain-containing protein [Hyalangium sp.]|uniref:heme NO-binding domain-containing protein n=1 Tax=Hyalangium sp. TaxID=2028555 RepID=UPI00389A0A55
MHGIIFNQLRSYAQARLGEQGWETLLREAGLGPRMYLAFQSYPDEQAEAIFLAASRKTGLSVRSLLEDFGEFNGPGMMKVYRTFIQPGWTIIDIVENAERIHERVRKDPHATPPRLKCQRINAKMIRVEYASPRMLCGVGIGFVRGLAHELGQRVEVQEAQCMHAGADSCVFLVKQVG